jgi:hypothetical protein
MGGNGVGLDSGGGSRGASLGGLGMRAIFSPFGLVTLSLMRSPGQEVASSRLRPPPQACFDQGGRFHYPTTSKSGPFKPSKAWASSSESTTVR